MIFKNRSTEKEIIDLRPLSGDETRQVYPLIERVNRYLGGTRVILSYLKKFSGKWDRRLPITLLDVGTGSADIPMSIARWARKHEWPVRITALDLSLENLLFAKKKLATYPEITFIKGTSENLPFKNESFDYVTASLFFHHLKDQEIVRNLKSFDRIAKRGIIINDLARSGRAYAGFFLFSMIAGRNPIFRHDGLLSVRRAFRKEEMTAYISAANLPWLKAASHFAFRLAIAGEKI